MEGLNVCSADLREIADAVATQPLEGDLAGLPDSGEKVRKTLALLEGDPGTTSEAITSPSSSNRIEFFSFLSPLSMSETSITALQASPFDAPGMKSTDELVHAVREQLKQIAERDDAAKALAEIALEFSQYRDLVQTGLAVQGTQDTVRGAVADIFDLAPRQVMVDGEVLTISSEETASSHMPSGVPLWFLDMQSRLESGALKKWAGKRVDGDPITFLRKRYGDLITKGLLTQAHLRALEEKLLIDLFGHIAYQKKIRKLPEAFKLSDIIPPSIDFAGKFAA